jgi:hypothetical protein
VDRASCTGREASWAGVVVMGDVKRQGASGLARLVGLRRRDGELGQLG